MRSATGRSVRVERPPCGRTNPALHGHIAAFMAAASDDARPDLVKSWKYNLAEGVGTVARVIAL